MTNVAQPAMEGASARSTTTIPQAIPVPVARIPNGNDAAEFREGVAKLG